jgi:hypothetical protein
MNGLGIQGGVPLTMGLPTVQGFPQMDVTVADQTFILSGVTRDAQGNALASCKVRLFMTNTDALSAGVQTSDPSTGAYAFAVQPLVTYYVVAYKTGSPDVEGTTVNTLVGT